MKLIVDSGNNYTKLALFEGDSMIKFNAIANPLVSEKVLRDFLHEYPVPRHAFFSTVGINEQAIIGLLEGIGIFVYTRNNAVNYPFKHQYKDISTLGFDRFAAAVGARLFFKNNPLVIIDAGTALTIDIVSAQGVFKGGSISPGMQLRFDSLHQKTGKLPLVSYQEKVLVAGNSPESCILSGVVNGMVFEISGFIEQYHKKFKNLKIIITGGDAKFLHKPLKKTIFADPYLVLKGLNEILNYCISSR